MLFGLDLEVTSRKLALSSSSWDKKKGRVQLIQKDEKGDRSVSESSPQRKVRRTQAHLSREFVQQIHQTIKRLIGP